MIDIESFNKGLKTTWDKTDVNNHGKWKLFFDLELRNYSGRTLFSGNLSKSDLSKYVNLSYPFIVEILNILSEITFENNTYNFLSSLRSSLFRFLLAGESESQGANAWGESKKRTGGGGGEERKRLFLSFPAPPPATDFFVTSVPEPSRDSRLPERKRKRLLHRLLSILF